MQYPLLTEYVSAINDAENNLDKLSHLRPVPDNHGEPLRSSGAFAIVFKMQDIDTGKYYALKCFIEEQQGRADAYQQIAEELEFIASNFIIKVHYLEKELFVDCSCDDDEFPVLLMDWVEGETMEEFIRKNHSDKNAMSMLCFQFCRLATWLRSQSFAHGDIKPDNIMVHADGSLTLVDYDGMYVPSMKGQKSPTIGTKDFSHPLRSVDDFDETIDDFTLASIALSLKAISLEPSLYSKYAAADRLLFSATDFNDLSRSSLMGSLIPLMSDNDFNTLYSLFMLAYAKKNLSSTSFKLFDFKKPKLEEVLFTEVTKEDIENGIEDESGVVYSPDGKRLLKCKRYNIETYIIKEGTKIIGDKAFSFCLSLTSIVIPDSVKNIGNYAFSRCSSLTSIVIPDSVKNIGDGAFARCYSLDNFTINTNRFKYINNGLYDIVEKKLIFVFPKVSGKYLIMDGISKIGDSAFDMCSFLTSIVIPDSVNNIGDGAFSRCYSLTSIVIPDSVKNIGNHAFSSCSHLTSIVIPDSVNNIEYGAFSYCSSLTSIVIPNGSIEKFQKMLNKDLHSILKEK